MMKIRKCIGKFLRNHMMWVYRRYEKIYWSVVDKRKKKGLHKFGYEYLKKINQVLDEFGFQYFVTYGTLLGIVRAGEFMGHDNDIDMGIINNIDFSWDKLEQILMGIGLNKKHQFVLEDKITEQTYTSGNLSVDFFLYDLYDEKHQISYVYFREENGKYEDNAFEVSCHITKKIENIKKIQNLKGTFSIPENSEEFLSEIYGKSWKVPQPNWKPERNIVEGKKGYLVR